LFINRENVKNITLATEGGCLPIPNINSCDELLNSSLNYIKIKNIKLIIVGACWDCYLITNSALYANELTKRKILLKKLSDFLLTLSKYGKVKLLLTNPTGDVLSPKSLLIGSRFGEYTYKNEVATFDLSKQQIALRNELYEISKQRDVEIIDPIKELCIGITCPYTLTDGTPLYKDKVHMRPFYVRDITYFDKIILINQ